MLTITDLFCGAGGSGLGAAAAGYRLVMAANHWQQAILTHAANFPDAEHDCADVSQVDPRRYPTTDVLWASPECTNHTQAKACKRGREGQPDLFGETLPDAAAERSRATMWDVPRFAERHAYRAVVVENVVEAARWVLFPAWLHAMEYLGYQHRIVSLNSMHAPADKRRARRSPATGCMSCSGAMASPRRTWRRDRSPGATSARARWRRSRRGRTDAASAATGSSISTCASAGTSWSRTRCLRRPRSTGPCRAPFPALSAARRAPRFLRVQ
jgi:C-5 cytosine-specific DNA methylase